jgi:hypothetical protein
MAKDFSIATGYTLRSSNATMEIGNIFRLQDDDGSEDDFWIHVNTNRFYILTGYGATDAWSGANPFMLDNASGLAYAYDQQLAFLTDIPTFTASTSDPSGGSDGDIHLKYID